MQHYNRYIPPDVEGTTSGNQLHKRRAPGMLKKDGSQTVRFEIPFAVWCHTCKPHAIIGQGVRFNAEKRKAGNYYSTPIWSFRMRHPACNGTIEIRTDPKNTAYVVVEGGKARDYGDLEDRVREGEGDIPLLTTEEREQRREDAFAQLEGKVEEKQQTQSNAKRIRELYDAGGRDWEDPWTANKRMRESFRRDRKAIKRQEMADQQLKDRIGTDIDLLPEADEDAKFARLISYGKGSTPDDAASKPFLPSKGDISSKSAKTSGKANAKDVLKGRLVSSTRAKVNPFG
ncbi:putative saf4/Yju2 protein [Septoria linicola]|nr:putative saf4/Yju2 protein [Septoria linicola]